MCCCLTERGRAGQAGANLLFLAHALLCCAVLGRMDRRMDGWKAVGVQGPQEVVESFVIVIVIVIAVIFGTNTVH